MSAVRALLLLAFAAPALAQEPGILLRNGRIHTLDAKSTVAEALAIRGERILAVGSTARMKRLIGKTTRVVELGGRTVIPGLIDSHMHAIRAALSFATEVNWIGASSIPEAMKRISDAARAKKAGSWLIVAGGWNIEQFQEKPRPAQAELTAAAGSNPAYVQLGYGWALLNPVGLQTLGIKSDADLPGGGRFEKDAEGKLTGGVSGGQGAIIALFDKLPKPTFEEQVEGTK